LDSNAVFFLHRVKGEPFGHDSTPRVTTKTTFLTLQVHMFEKIYFALFFLLVGLGLTRFLWARDTAHGQDTVMVLEQVARVEEML